MLRILKSFRQFYPNVRLELNQGSPQDIVNMVQAGEVDVGIASEILLNNSSSWSQRVHSVRNPLMS
ncbi:LysR substrate-binding domain-containing protein [Pantoea stewartii]|uniref:LysR substrate-binding domain-containing protein n=1 Tax=Pantoea stewartii TaxID=66269 RepID=UPI001CF77B81|nr:LysR substrate-binding domain-containing protein [Pantoea stewartii]